MSPGTRRRNRPVSDRPHPPLSGRQRPNLAPVIDVLAVQGRLRLQAPLHAQRALRPELARLLRGTARGSRARHGSYGVARVLHIRAVRSARRGQVEWRMGDPSGHLGASAPVVRPSGSRSGPRDQAWTPRDSGLLEALPRNMLAHPPGSLEGSIGDGLVVRRCHTDGPGGAAPAGRWHRWPPGGAMTSCDIEL